MRGFPLNQLQAAMSFQNLWWCSNPKNRELELVFLPHLLNWSELNQVVLLCVFPSHCFPWGILWCFYKVLVRYCWRVIRVQFWWWSSSSWNYVVEEAKLSEVSEKFLSIWSSPPMVVTLLFDLLLRLRFCARCQQFDWLNWHDFLCRICALTFSAWITVTL